MGKSNFCDRPLNRRRASKELSTLHWVFCEGATSEDCICRLRGHWRYPKLRIHVEGQLGVPWTVVSRATAKHKELKARRVKGYTIHVVFDRDSHPKFREAIVKARALGFSIGVSVPCIELWGVLLHQDQTAHITRHAAQSLLKRIHPDYDHRRYPYFDLTTVLEGLDDAKSRSSNLLRRALDADDEFYNPTSKFSDVISAIQQ